MGKQFADCVSQYSAPMGRRETRITPDNMPAERSLRLFRVRLDRGGYDDGGAYWGAGQPLYCLRGDGPVEEIRVFVRANSREAAKAALGVAPHLLAKA